MKNKLKSIFVLSLFTVMGAFAQSGYIGIGTTNPKATLDVTGTPGTVTTADGIIAPRLTGNQLAAKTAYGTDQTAAQVYVTAAATTPAGATINVTAPGYYYFDGTAWQKVGGSSSKFDYNPTTTSIDLKYLSNGVTARPAEKRFTINDNGSLLVGGAEFTSDKLVLDSGTPNVSIILGGTNYASGVPYFNQTQFNGNKARGILGSPTSALAGDYHTTLSSGNYGVTGWHFNSTAISFLQEDTPTATSNPTQIRFTTTSTNSLAQTDKMIIKADGNVGIGTTTPNASAQLDLSTTTRGFLPPRMTSAQMNLINSPAEGLIVYCTNCLTSKGLRVFDGIDWVNMQGAPAPIATFTFTGNYYHVPNFYASKVMGADNSLFMEVNVTSAGAIKFSSATINGYKFTANAEIATTGIQYVEIIPTGTQTAYNAGGDAFTITGLGSSSQTAPITISNVQAGASFSTHFNGITAGVSVDNLLATYTTGETFNNNTACASMPISASACVGSTIAVGSNTYNIANINGQCWMTQNLKELPNGVAVNATQWLATTISDLGYYGYYNATTFNGTAGWATTEPAAGEGLLYQWSAAMLGSTTERAKGVCPAGWHIPSDCEIQYLEHGQGMALSEQNLTGFRANTTVSQGTPGYKLRSAGVGQTNASGFSAVLNGRRNTNGTFSNRTNGTFIWSSSQSGANGAFNRWMNTGRGVSRSSDTKALAHSIRCLKN